MINVEVHGLTQLSKTLGAYSKEEQKALNTAMRVEGFRLRKLLIKQLKAGKPGGAQFAPLSEIARRYQYEGARYGVLRGKDRALNTLAKAVRYDAPKDANPVVYRIGFVDITGRDKLSRSWKSIAERQQQGFSTPLPTSYIRGSLDTKQELAKTGGLLMKKRGWKKSDRLRFFFLRKSTTSIHVPARPIIAPFWNAEKSAVFGNIKRNYRAKLQGKRI